MTKFGESTHYDYFMNEKLGNDYNEHLSLGDGDVSGLDFYMVQWSHGLMSSASMLNKNRVKPFELKDLDIADIIYPEGSDG